jgi:hypothetical protein
MNETEERVVQILTFTSPNKGGPDQRRKGRFWRERGEPVKEAVS